MKKNILEILPGVREKISLASYTTYKIGGPAKYFFIAKTKEDLIGVVLAAKKMNTPVFVLGAGSNVLFSDKGFKGLVIKIQISGCEIHGNKIIVGAGMDLTKLSYFSADAGLSGLEWAAGIPGTLGGAIYGNAQAFGAKTADIIEEVEVLDLKSLKIKKFSKNQCKFSLKTSIFKKNKNLVIISATLIMKEADIPSIKNKIKEFINYRRISHPINFPSAGSTFVNPEKKITNKKFIEKYPELIGYNLKGVIPAGFLIAKSGLAGRKKGKAMISEKHANFIVNLGKAKAADVLFLINLSKKEVKKKFGIELKPEVQLIEF